MGPAATSGVVTDEPLLLALVMLCIEADTIEFVGKVVRARAG